jgi:transcriptional regulator with XRE-family HTH domain
MSNHPIPAEADLDNNSVSEKFFEEVQDFGSVLRALRINQGYTIEVMSKKLGLPPAKISEIERSVSDIPTDLLLRDWLRKLGCKDNLDKLMILARRHRVAHSIRLHAKEECNADLIRLIELYKQKKLTPFDKALLSLIGR